MKPIQELSSPSVCPLNREFGSRLIRLCDGRAGLRGWLQAEVREPLSPPAGPQPSGPILDFIASSGARDRYEEIIEPSGWRLDNYRRNPVFQNAHQYGDILFTLGRALLTEVRRLEPAVGSAREVLFQRIEFAVEANPMARIAYGLYRGRFLNGLSVGFIPLRWENGGVNAPYKRKHLEQELLESSAVGIPANPEALQLGLRAGALAKADLRELFELLRCQMQRGGPLPAFGPAQGIFGSQPAARLPDTRALGGRCNEAHWLQLARALKQLLRGA